MNNFFKIIISTLGAINIIFQMFIPIAIALMIITLYPLSLFSQRVLIVVGCLSSVYQAINIAFLKGYGR